MVFITKIARFGVQLSGAAVRSLHRAPAVTHFRQLSVSTFLSSDRRYTDKHEWVALDGTIATVGITNYAQEALGDVVFAQLPDPGTLLKQDDECGALESVKAASEVYSPVGGEVTEKNSSVEETPALINTNCYTKGWLFKITLKNPSEIEKLMTEEQYQDFLKSEQH